MFTWESFSSLFLICKMKQKPWVCCKLCYNKSFQQKWESGTFAGVGLYTQEIHLSDSVLESKEKLYIMCLVSVSYTWVETDTTSPACYFAWANCSGFLSKTMDMFVRVLLPLSEEKLTLLWCFSLINSRDTSLLSIPNHYCSITNPTYLPRFFIAQNNPGFINCSLKLSYKTLIWL